MAVNNYPIVAIEGRLCIGITAIVAIASAYLFGWLLSIPFWLLLCLFLYMFRDPYREIPSSPLAIICPVDGKIVDIQNCHDPYLKRDSICISIDMNTLGVYSIRSPIEGKVQERWFGSSADSEKQENKDINQYSSWIQTDEEDDIVLAMIAKSASRNLRCYTQSGERVGQGQRCGFARFGANIVLYFSVNSIVEVKPGDKVQAGSDILAKLVH